MPMNRRLAPAALLSAALLSLPVGLALATDQLLPGRVGIIRPLGYAKFVAVSPAGMPFDPPDVGDDPTVEGGTLRIFDTGSSGGDHTYGLPAGNWMAIGSPGSGQFRYKRAVFSDPVRRVYVKGRVVKAIVQRQGPDWTPPFSGEMAVVLTVGTASRFCLSFGGTTIANSAKRLNRKLAPAPASCASPSGAFLEETRGALFD
jgi:hypothetical protein